MSQLGWQQAGIKKNGCRVSKVATASNVALCSSGEVVVSF